MTRPFALTLIPAAFASTLLAAAPAAAEPAQQAVALCRAQMLSSFPEGAVRNYRVADISGNSRRTRVTINVTADRRYTFECATGADGRIATASFNPSRDTQLTAAGQR